MRMNEDEYGYESNDLGRRRMIPERAIVKQNLHLSGFPRASQPLNPGSWQPYQLRNFKAAGRHRSKRNSTPNDAGPGSRISGHEPTLQYLSFAG
jgi:hypothetical protein